MTTVHLDPDTGRVRLDTDAFQALLGAVGVTGSSPDTRAVAELERCGVLTAGGPAPVARRALDAVVESGCRMRLDVAAPRRVAVHHAWTTARTTALLLEVTEGLHDLVAVAPEAVPGLLARTVRLGPRKTHATDRRTVPLGTADELVHEDDTRRAAAFAAAGAAEGHWAWRLQVAWPDPTGAQGLAGQGLTVLDGAHGPCLVEEDDTARPHPAPGRQVVRPVTATQVWCVLSELSALAVDVTRGATGAPEGPA